MDLSTGSTQLQFAAEFAVFLVALAGIGLVVLRVGLPLRRPLARFALLGGFAALCLAAGLHGSLTVDANDATGLVLLRAVGAIAALLGAFYCDEDRAGRGLLLVGLAFVALAEAAVLADGDRIADVSRLLGAMSLGAALLRTGRRSIPVRIALSTVGVVLVVVLAVSVALASVLSRTVEDQAFKRQVSLSISESSVLAATTASTLRTAENMATALAGSPTSLTALRVLANPDTPGFGRTDSSAKIGRDLALLLEKLSSPGSQALFVDQRGAAQALAAGTSESEPVPTSRLFKLAGSEPVEEARTDAVSTQGVVVVDAGAVALGVAVVDARTAEGIERLGVIAVAVPLDGSYLAPRVQGLLTGQALSLVTPEQVLAHASNKGGDAPQLELPTGPAAIGLVALARRADAEPVDEGGRPEATSAVVSGSFAVGRRVDLADADQALVLVSSEPTSEIGKAREQLFTTLYLVALGGALVTLALAGLVGQRIGAGLRRLTSATTAMEGGDLSVRADVALDDELGQLGRGFNAMAASLEEQVAAIQRLVAEESELRAQLQAVIGGMGEALLAVDPSGTITEWNRAAHDLLGLPADAAHGRPVGEVVRLRTPDGETDLSGRLAASGAPDARRRWQLDGVVETLDGQSVPVTVTGGQVSGPSGDVVGAVFVLRDMRRERALERMRSEFIQNIGHELRTPLTPIKGYVRFLATRDLPPEKVKEFAVEMQASSAQLERVLTQLANFNTVSSGSLQLHRAPIDLRAVLDAAIVEWSTRAPNHRFTRRISRGLPVLEADGAYLGQALTELLDNAVKFSPDGGRVDVSVTASADQRQIEIAVRDRGIGIPEEQRGSVLEDFVQGDGSATRRFGGLGVGLALVRRVAEAHGGTVTFDSEPGRGSVFTLAFPAVEPRRPTNGTSRRGRLDPRRVPIRTSR